MVNSANADNINVCDNVSDYIFIADISNCTKYSVCVNHAPIQQECDNKLNFDGPSQSCLSSNSGCYTCDPNVFTISALAKTCNKYVICYAGVAVLRQCADDLQYDRATGECDKPAKVQCIDDQCSIFNNETNIKFVPSIATCDKYYICMNGNPIERNCSKGLVFNPNINKCDYTQNYNCTITADKRTTKTVFKSPPIIADIKCPQQGTHFYPHNDYSRYYLCSNGKGTILSCADGLSYDRTISACREPKHIKF